MRRKWVLTGVVGGFLISLLFNNCTAQHQGSDNSGFSLSSEVTFAPCSFTDETDLFSKTYYPFVSGKCVGCHVAGGQAATRPFASPGLVVAFGAFDVLGFSKISEFATSNDHNSLQTGGAANQPEIDLLKMQWVNGLTNIAECKDGGGGITDPTPPDDENRVRTKSKGVNAPASGYVNISWNLATELLDQGKPLPSLPGSSISLRLRKITLGGKVMYEVSLPSLTTANSDIKIQSLLIQLNGKSVPNQTTFRYIDEGVFAHTDGYVLAPGAMVIDGAISDTDVIGLSIGRISEEVLPPRPPLPSVGFDVPNKSTAERGLAQVKLVLSEANTSQYVTVTVGISTIGSPATLAKNRRSMTIGTGNMRKVIDRWDWDYTIDTQAVVFAPGETEKLLSLTISDDQRDEQDETLVFVVGSAVNAIKSTANTLELTILDDDGPNVSGAPSFSDLMQPNGILFKNCIECHNSVDNRGGYNLSDYNWMITSGVLIPGNPTSKMFERMNSQTPGIPPMPLTGLLTAPERVQVENWIKAGAKND